MNIIRIFVFESAHFRKTPSKIVSYLLFFLACLYAIYNGFDLQQKQRDTIQNIKQEQTEEIRKVLVWFEEGKKGPEDRAWINIHEPYWSLLESSELVSGSLLEDFCIRWSFDGFLDVVVAFTLPPISFLSTFTLLATFALLAPFVSTFSSPKRIHESLKQIHPLFYDS